MKRNSKRIFPTSTRFTDLNLNPNDFYAKIFVRRHRPRYSSIAAGICQKHVRFSFVRKRRARQTRSLITVFYVMANKSGRQPTSAGILSNGSSYTFMSARIARGKRQTDRLKTCRSCTTAIYENGYNNETGPREETFRPSSK